MAVVYVRSLVRWDAMGYSGVQWGGVQWGVVQWGGGCSGVWCSGVGCSVVWHANHPIKEGWLLDVG